MLKIEQKEREVSVFKINREIEKSVFKIEQRKRSQCLK